jgi:hypothetical protein
MTNPIIKIIDLSTNEVIERPMNDEEFAALLESAAKTAAFEANIAAKTEARQAVLDRLGITAEEAQLILGGSN